MDYHKILGTRPGDNLDKIKSAYRRKAAQLHPDKGGSAQEFAQLHEAYEQLKKQASQRIDIPIYTAVETIRVQIPMERLIEAGRYQFTYKDKAVEVSLPNWQLDWHHEHTFNLKDQNLKLIVVADHSKFWIQDNTLVTRIDITALDSLLGTTIYIMDQSVVVPRGIVTGDQQTVPGLGLFFGDQRHDLTCIFNIVPVQLADDDVDLPLRKLQEKYRKY